jgi:hypothetical protein
LQLNSAQFRDLLETVALGWNSGNARVAADCFTSDALYTSPPSSHVRRGREELFQFFGGSPGRPKPMSMEWHHIVFDEASQIGMGEYTFTYEIRTHGIVAVRVADGKISNWREYEIESPLDWRQLTIPNSF